MEASLDYSRDVTGEVNFAQYWEEAKEGEGKKTLEKQARLAAEQKAQRLADRLRILGINPDEV